MHARFTSALTAFTVGAGLAAALTGDQAVEPANAASPQGKVVKATAPVCPHGVLRLKDGAAPAHIAGHDTAAVFDDETQSDLFKGSDRKLPRDVAGRLDAGLLDLFGLSRDSLLKATTLPDDMMLDVEQLRDDGQLHIRTLIYGGIPAGVYGVGDTLRIGLTGIGENPNPGYSELKPPVITFQNMMIVAIASLADPDVPDSMRDDLPTAPADSNQGQPAATPRDSLQPAGTTSDDIAAAFVNWAALLQEQNAAFRVIALTTPRGGDYMVMDASYFDAENATHIAAPGELKVSGVQWKINGECIEADRIRVGLLLQPVRLQHP